MRVMPRKCWRKLLGGLLAMTSVMSVLAQDAVLYQPSNPSALFDAGLSALIMKRDADIESTPNFLVGPDDSLANFGAADFDYQGGLRGFLAVQLEGIRLEAVFSDFGVWSYGNSGLLTDGIAWDEGSGGVWGGANLIDLTTPFRGLHAAAAAGLGGDPDESEGLGPNGGFGDITPTWEVFYKSRLQTFELNLLSQDVEMPFQVGLGYRNLQLDEQAGAAFQGTFRADDGVAPNNGLSHIALTTAGGMTFLSGVPDGFEDENGNPSTLPDVVTMLSQATTSNDLNGVQLLFREQVMYWRGWTIDFVGNAGLYHNHASGSIGERHAGFEPVPNGAGSVYGRGISDSEDRLAFVGGAGLQSNFPLSQNWSLISGYELLFVHGVALAPDQFAQYRSGIYNIDTHGQLLAHGANVGFQFLY
jgi:hypothetical protein